MHAVSMLATLDFVSLYEPCSIDSVNHVLRVSSISLCPAVFPSPLLWGSSIANGRVPMETSNLKVANIGT